MASKRTGIQKLPNGRFRARYFSGYDATTGKRVYPSRTFDREGDAADWLAEERCSLTSRSVEGRGVTVGAYLDHWLTTRLGLRENSRESYRSAINAHIKPSLGRVKLNRLTATQIEAWQADLLKRISGTTVGFARSILYGALESARKKNMVRSNVVAATEGPKKNKVTRYPLSIDDALRFMAACHDGRRLGLLFQIMLTCGLRPEEVIGLQWSMIEMSAERRVVRVERVIHHLKKGAGWRWSEPKTKNSERVIGLPEDLAAKLMDHRKSQLEKKLRAGQNWQDNDLVFCTSLGHPITYYAFNYHFKGTLRRAELPTTITPYALRHFFVTSSLVAGVDAKTVSREAGHASVAFTLDVYGHVLDEAHDNAARLREALLKSRRK